jgi:UDP-N-acetylmuramate--alanine ligase
MDTGQILAEMICAGELRIHLIGVAGSGMSGIAGLLMSLGHHVSGSDKVTTIEVERLQSIGLKFNCPHDPAAIANSDLVIFSSAVRAGNPEYDEAVRTGASMVRRADALAAIMNCKKGILVAGMHGKTTTSAMAAHVLRVGGVKPSHYVGAEIPILGTNAHWDPHGEWFVAEGDESDGTIVNYHPTHTILLNVEPEHLDYYENIEAIEAVFRQVLNQTTGTIFFCADDPLASELCAGRERTVAFGSSEWASVRFGNRVCENYQSKFDVYSNGELLGRAVLNVPGQHNVSNAMSVIALALALGIPFPKIAEALESFRGARRRFEIKYRDDDFMVVDDYAHHPSEIRATLATAKSGNGKRVVVMFQPHRYSRTAALKNEFGSAFHDADLVFVTDIYPANERPIDGVTGATVVEAIQANGHLAAEYVPDLHRMISGAVGRMLEPGDLVLSLGAGDIHTQSTVLAKDLVVRAELAAAMGPGVIKLCEPIAKHTTLRVGGPAQFWIEPETEAGFANLVKFCNERGIPLMVMGRGSNLLVRDGGIRGVVIHLARGEFKQLRVNDGLVHAGVGVKLKDVAYAARDAEIGGFEWMEGIPGNVGGGLRMNAGAMGSETFDQVVSVRFVDAQGNIHEKTPAELEVHYREVPTLRTNYAISAAFKGHPSTAEEIARGLEESMHKRRTTQPRESSAGCIFKNPGPCPAGKLVDELGLKNTAIGKARVSEVHGNFIVNDGGATAAEVLKLIAHVQATALRERGIKLETEVQIVGEEEEFA